MRTLLAALSLAAASMIAVPAHSQSSGEAELIWLDLAAPVLERTVEPGTYRFQLRKALPLDDYTFRVTRDVVTYPMLSIKDATESLKPVAEDGCTDDLKNLVSVLDTVAMESRLDRALANWSADQPLDCRARGRQIFDSLTTRVISGSYSISRSAKLKVEVSRPALDGTADWTFVMSTLAPGAWSTQYGFNFLPDRDERFFTQSVPDSDGKFVIKEEREMGDGSGGPLSYVPSVLFTWVPTRTWHGFALGAAAGVGYDLKSIALFVGPAITFRQNLTLTGGLAVHEQARLNGRYAGGDTIQENLTIDQLHVDRFRPNVFFGLSLRLDRNPFESSPPEIEGSKPAEVEGNAAPDKDGAARAGSPPAVGG